MARCFRWVLSVADPFVSLVASTTAPIATEWNEPAPGRDFHPLWISAFPRRTEKAALTCRRRQFRAALFHQLDELWLFSKPQRLKLLAEAHQNPRHAPL